MEIKSNNAVKDREFYCETYNMQHFISKLCLFYSCI